MDRNTVNMTAKKILDAKCHILKTYPFFGRILLRMPILFSEKGTACTDGVRIIFAIDFAKGLGTDEIIFVMLHEIMHNVLKHTLRGRELSPLAYNVACDIVVNSLLLECMGLTDIEIAGQKAMHLTPDGREGRLFTAEEVYDMLRSDPKSDNDGGTAIDSHDNWKDIPQDQMISESWDVYIKEALIKANGTLPLNLKRLVTPKASNKIDWKQVLHDFIRYTGYDFIFSPPDRRFQGKLIIPMFTNLSDEMSVDRLWFCADTSGSITSKMLAETLGEVRSAVSQMDNLSGAISFFDTKVTPPVPFDSIETLDGIEPTGGGGTDFRPIFAQLPDYFRDELPKCIIILTDGYAPFPEESKALGLPVLWIIIGSSVTPPFGTVIHI